MENNPEKETKIEILSQFLIYTLFAIITTIINLGGQVLFTNILLLNYVLGALIALAIGYTTKFFLDCYITFEKQRKEEMDIRKHYLVYMLTAILFYILNVIIQIYIATPIVENLFLKPFQKPLVDLEIIPVPLLITLLSAAGAVAIVFLIKFPFDKYIVFKLVPEILTQ
ncbi:MAG: GtrA family protein [Candidatus Helarchaeota archaeon]